MTDKIFADGLIVKRNENAPEFVVCNLSVKAAEFMSFCKQHHKDGWVNLQVKLSKGGKYYAELDTWEPNRADVHAAGMEQARAAAPPPELQPIADDDVPF